ncbi:MAG: hypothetical protein JWN32_2109, partial [Solirubrobacterales bacterium]|nr:hypothetical protein [Solirubrobacterales bacterium]
AGIAVLAGAAVTAFRIVRLRRGGRGGDVAVDRRLLERGWQPTWRRARLDLVAIGVGLAILVVDIVSGGLKQTQVEGTTVALSFWVLLAPIALWLGFTLLAVRGLLAGVARWASPERGRPPGTWGSTVLRWLGRRPARTGVALVLGTLAVAFGTYVVAFVATYRQAKADDAKAAFASDLHLTAASDTRLTPPPLGSRVAASSPIRVVPARVGSDRKSILTLDLSSYAAVSAVSPRMLRGESVAGLARDPKGILVAKEIADGFAVGPGDTLTLTVFPDDEERSRNLTFHVLGVYRSVPPSNPPTELVMSTAAVASFLLPTPDFYLARVAPGQSAAGVAAALKQGPVGRDFNVTTRADRVRTAQRSLASLNLGGLSDIEAIGAGLVAAVGVAVLGAFVVLERRREFAILRAVGADTSALLTGPAQEGAVAVLGSIVVGVPLGLGLALVAVRVLGLFFTLPPPLLAIPVGALAAFVLFMLAASAVALGGALLRVTRATASSVLREP